MKLTFSPAKHMVLMLLICVALFPIYFVLVNSVKDTLEFAQNPWFLPPHFHWDNYSVAWNTVLHPIINSCAIVSVSIAGILMCAALSAYSFSVLQFPGRRALFALVFVLLLIPSFLTLIPLYLQIQRLNLNNNYLGLILPYIAAGQALSIFVLKTFFDGVSRELVEAARIDGAGDLRVFRSIMLPLSVPILVTVGIVNLIPLWNDYLLPNLLLDPNHATLPMALVAFQGNAETHTSPEFGPLMASYALAAVPLAILLSFLMRYYVEGLTKGALKM